MAQSYEDDIAELTSDSDFYAEDTDTASDPNVSDTESQEILDNVGKFLAEDSDDLEEVVEDLEESEADEDESDSDEVAETEEKVEEDEVSDQEETSDEVEEETEEEEGNLDSQHVPYKRFAEVVKEKNINKADAETFRGLRKAYQEAEITDDTFQNWSKLGILINKDPEAAAPYVRALAESVGLKVSVALSDDLKKMVDDGEVEEEAAYRLAAQRLSEPRQADDIEVPSFAPTAPNPEEAMKQVAQLYEGQYKGFWTPEVIKKVTAGIEARKAEYERVYGQELPAERLSLLADEACKDVVKETRAAKMKRSTVAQKPLRPKRRAVTTNANPSSVRDFVSTNQYLKDI